MVKGGLAIQCMATRFDFNAMIGVVKLGGYWISV